MKSETQLFKKTRVTTRIYVRKALLDILYLIQ